MVDRPGAGADGGADARKAAGRLGAGRKPLWLLAAPLVFMLLWSGGYSAVKIGLQTIPPFYLLAIRYIMVLAVLVPAFFIFRPRLPATGLHWRHLIVVGLCIQGLYFGGTNLAVGLNVSAAVLGIVLALQPILVALLAPHFVGERVGRYAWLGLALGLAGAVIAILAKSRIGEVTTAGILVTLFSLMFITIGTLYEKRFGIDQHPIVANAVQCAVGLALILPVAAATETFRFEWSWPLVLSLIYSAFCNSIVAMSLLFAMIRHGEASRASALLFLVPPTSAAFAWYFFGEEMPVATWFGMALAGIGVFLVRRG